MIYETLPDEHQYDTTALERHTVQIAIENAEGVINSKEIAHKAGLPSTGTREKVRKIITELICLDEQPIVAVGSRGYLWAHSPEQVRRYREKLEQNILGIQRRQDALLRIERRMRGME